MADEVCVWYTSVVTALWKKGIQSPISGYVDADYGGCLDTRKSISGYVFQVLGGNVSWRACL